LRVARDVYCENWGKGGGKKKGTGKNTTFGFSGKTVGNFYHNWKHGEGSVVDVKSVNNIVRVCGGGGGGCAAMLL